MIGLNLMVSIALLTLPASPGSRTIEGLQDTTYVTQVSEGEVTLELSPEWQDSVLVVELRANTHSVDLDGMNLGEQVRLIVGDVEVTPSQAGSFSGHHGQTTVAFRLDEQPSAFRIEIRDVPDVPLRVLTWPKSES